MRTHVFLSVKRAHNLLLLVMIPLAASAQVVPTASGGNTIGKWELFGGYSYLAPATVVTGQVRSQADCIGSRRSSATLAANGLWNCPVGMEAEMHGSIESITRKLTGRMGIQIEGAQHDIYYNDPKSLQSNTGIWTVQAGPVYRFAGDRFMPWIHVLAGGGEMQGPNHQNYTPGFTMTGGGGVDLRTRWMDHRIAIRLAEADYEYMRVDYGKAHLSTHGWQPGGLANMTDGLRLSAGIVFRFR
jgi:hypothetical protein